MLNHGEGFWKGASMTEALQVLITRARRVRMTEAQQEEQRQSFAYGTTKIENELVTKPEFPICRFLDENHEAVRRIKQASGGPGRAARRLTAAF
jgi:hypothetical protein